MSDIKSGPPKRKFGGKQQGAGRPPGTPNKVTQTVREQVKLALGGVDIVDRMLEIAKEKPQLALDIYTNLLPYCCAKLRHVEFKGEVDATLKADEDVKEVAKWLAEMRTESLS